MLELVPTGRSELNVIRIDTDFVAAPVVQFPPPRSIWRRRSRNWSVQSFPSDAVGILGPVLLVMNRRILCLRALGSLPFPAPRGRIDDVLAAQPNQSRNEFTFSWHG